MSDIVYERQVHELRSWYIDAAIAELNLVCNLVLNEDPLRSEFLLAEAEKAGERAQSSFEKFVECVTNYRASKENED